MGTGKDERRFQIDDLGAVIIVLACLGLIALGKETAAFIGIVHTIIGFLFGKHTRKGKK
jgi:MFS-type transporter involved in bile tolerance (Atg22 family)